jgi:hypothetical protein
VKSFRGLEAYNFVTVTKVSADGVNLMGESTIELVTSIKKMLANTPFRFFFYARFIFPQE